MTPLSCVPGMVEPILAGEVRPVLTENGKAASTSAVPSAGAFMRKKPKRECG